MHRKVTPFLSSLFALLVLCAARSASAADSTHPGMYVEGSPLGTGTIAYGCINDGARCLGGGEYGAYRISAEFGYHFSQRHDGLVLGVRQVFLFGTYVGGITEARVGWDIAIPVKQFEVTVAPYGIAGAAYVFNGFGGSHAALALGVGAEGKFFFKDNLYAFLIPVELGGWVGNGYNGVEYQAGAGIGYAF